MYIVLEIQVNGDQVATIVTKFATRAEAEAHYHSILSFAATSAVQIHSAVILSVEGKELMRQSYIHMPPPVVTIPEPVEEEVTTVPEPVEEEPIEEEEE